jgi:hypothetical protein
MALFKVNTGLREQEVVNLRWSWEVQVPELGASIFVIPRDYVKNGLDRCVVLNRIARSVIERCRGQHSEFVFTRAGQPVTKIYNSRMEGGAQALLGTLCPGAWEAMSRRLSSPAGA